MIYHDFPKPNNLLKSNKQDVNFLIGELNAKIICTAAPYIQVELFKTNNLYKQYLETALLSKKRFRTGLQKLLLKNNASWRLVHSHLWLILLLLIDSVISLKFHFLTIEVASFQQYTIATTLKQLQKDLVKLRLKKYTTMVFRTSSNLI